MLVHVVHEMNIIWASDSCVCSDDDPCVCSHEMNVVWAKVLQRICEGMDDIFIGEMPGYLLYSSHTTLERLLNTISSDTSSSLSLTSSL